jgi:hypothetical protein
MDLQILWGAQEAELDGDMPVLDRAIGLRGADFEQAPLPPGTRARPTTGGIGKGASGTGVGLALEIAEHAINDIASLIGIGYALRALISRVSHARGQGPAGANAEGLTALAAAETMAIAEGPDEWYHTRTVPLTTDGSVGTDMRDVWAAAFVSESLGHVQLAFYSSTTRYLGSAVVAMEWFFDGSEGVLRSDGDLAHVLDSWFSPDVR